ncbi:hypothetical protein QVD17_39867 [Tagetes erecta]|uniref:Small ribosomal subunit protein uS3 C-terminal domain-containing protein n=1 Tax=Tagetes erecta TaxID=13708 RepID=A0AAD8JPB5_TARER|nr:hypothetical protein QVD17_39867 [Tagetes erecta]
MSGGAEIARNECENYGKTSSNVFNQKIDYAPAEVSTRYGISGVKVWISYSQKERGARALRDQKEKRKLFVARSPKSFFGQERLHFQTSSEGTSTASPDAGPVPHHGNTVSDSTDGPVSPVHFESDEMIGGGGGLYLRGTIPKVAYSTLDKAHPFLRFAALLAYPCPVACPSSMPRGGVGSFPKKEWKSDSLTFRQESFTPADAI